MNHADARRPGQASSTPCSSAPMPAKHCCACRKPLPGLFDIGRAYAMWTCARCRWWRHLRSGDLRLRRAAWAAATWCKPAAAEGMNDARWVAVRPAPGRLPTTWAQPPASAARRLPNWPPNARSGRFGLTPMQRLGWILRSALFFLRHRGPWGSFVVLGVDLRARRHRCTGSAWAGCARRSGGARLICGVLTRITGLEEPARRARSRRCCSRQAQSDLGDLRPG